MTTNNSYAMPKRMTTNNFDAIIKEKLQGFPVGVWVPYYPSQFSPEWLAGIRECGINFVPCSPEEVPAVAAAGIKCLVGDDRVTYVNIGDFTHIAEWIKPLAGNKDIIGMFVWDEPSPAMQRMCGAINTEIQRVLPEFFGYINLHPSYSDDEQRNGMTYEEYLENFVAHASPKLLSYDHYPFLNGDKLTDDYFYNLQAVRDCCNRHGLEFWTFIQSCSFLENRTPSPEDMAWQAFTSLAYGAKGLLYFTYATVTHDKKPHFGPAMVDKEGRRTDRWYAAQKINAFLKEHGSTLLGLKHEGVMFFGWPEQSTVQSFGGLKGAEGGSVLVGCFTAADGKYLLPVNLDLKRAADVVLVFEDRKLPLSLGAGEGELIKL